MKLDLTNKKFGKLTARFESGKSNAGKTLWFCDCDCGGSASVTTGDLRSGNNKSCGCGKYDGLIANVETKKLNAVGSRHPLARSSWRWMIDRCTNPKNKDYAIYGGRGITVCSSWMLLENFLHDMGDPLPGYTIDRIDTNGNYEPGNCRWATPTQQARNTRRNVLIEHNGRTVTVAEASEDSGIPASTIYSRVARGAKPV